MPRTALSVALVLIGAFNGFSMTITVVRGQNASNILRPRLAALPIIEVRDARGKPMPGVVVRFSAPQAAPTVTFPDGSHSLRAVTDEHGRAAVDLMIPEGAGNYRIELTAEFAGEHADTVLVENNYTTMKEAAKSGVPANDLVRVESGTGLSTGAKIGIIAGLAALAAGAAAFFATRGHHSHAPITVGTPTVGAPT